MNQPFFFYLPPNLACKKIKTYYNKTKRRHVSRAVLLNQISAYEKPSESTRRTIMATTSGSRPKTALIFFFLFALIALLVICIILQGKIEQNPPGTIGNTAGNLNNKGLFCEQNGVVYFANAYDNGTLYSMNADETNIQKLSDAQAQSINAAGDYLYYYQTDIAGDKDLGFIAHALGLYRSKTNGKDALCLKRDPCATVVLVDNTLYYQHFDNQGAGMTLYQMDTDKKNDKQVLKEAANPASIQDGCIYYNGTTDNHHLYQYNTYTGTSSIIWNGNLWNPVVIGNYVYYMDVSDNYKLCRRQLDAEGTELLTTDRVDMFNIYGDYIYYQKSSATEPALKRMRLDGSENEIVAEGVYQNINITSSYVYFNAYDAPTPVYKTPVYGPVNVTEFTAAAVAVSTK